MKKMASTLEIFFNAIKHHPELQGELMKMLQENPLFAKLMPQKQAPKPEVKAPEAVIAKKWLNKNCKYGK